MISLTFSPKHETIKQLLLYGINLRFICFFPICHREMLSYHYFKILSLPLRLFDMLSLLYWLQKLYNLIYNWKIVLLAAKWAYQNTTIATF